MKFLYYRVYDQEGNLLAETFRASKAWKAMPDNGEVYRILDVKLRFDRKTWIRLSVKKRLTR